MTRRCPKCGLTLDVPAYLALGPCPECRSPMVTLETKPTLVVVPQGADYRLCVVDGCTHATVQGTTKGPWCRNHHPLRCAATGVEGKRCRNLAPYLGGYCWKHGGASTTSPPF